MRGCYKYFVPTALKTVGVCVSAIDCVRADRAADTDIRKLSAHVRQKRLDIPADVHSANPTPTGRSNASPGTEVSNRVLA